LFNLEIYLLPVPTDLVQRVVSLVSLVNASCATLPTLILYVILPFQSLTLPSTSQTVQCVIVQSVLRPFLTLLLPNPFTPLATLQAYSFP